MSDANDHDDDAGDENPNAENIKNLRRMADEGKAAKAEAAAAKRENLFLRAGIDTESEVGKLLLKAYEGEDLEELKAMAQRIGALTAPAKTPEELEREAEDNIRRQVQQAQAGGQAGGQGAEGEFSGEHPMTEALAAFQQNRKEGMDLEQAQIDAVARVLGAANKGDKRVFFDRDRHDRLAAEADALAVRR